MQQFGIQRIARIGEDVRLEAEAVGERRKSLVPEPSPQGWG